VHELPARGVSEQPIALLGSDALGAQQVEQPFVDAKRPFFAPARRAVLIVQIAEMVPEMLGERRLGELDGDCQNAGRVD
jgi:hypothetical protein